MRRSIELLLALVLVGLFSVPAMATVEKNPNAETLLNVSCEDGSSIDATAVVPARGVRAHPIGEGDGGVATSVYLFLTKTDAESADKSVALEAIFDRPGEGLDRISTWCIWQSEFLPDLWFGGDILT